jgi:hypothetical protein
VVEKQSQNPAVLSTTFLCGRILLPVAHKKYDLPRDFIEGQPWLKGLSGKNKRGGD